MAQEDRRIIIALQSEMLARKFDKDGEFAKSFRAGTVRVVRPVWNALYQLPPLADQAVLVLDLFPDQHEDTMDLVRRVREKRWRPKILLLVPDETYKTAYDEVKDLVDHVISYSVEGQRLPNSIAPYCRRVLFT